MGESQVASNNLKVGSFVLKGIPRGGRGKEIRIIFEVDEDTCSIDVMANVTGTKVTAEQRFPPPMDLDAEAIRRLIEQAEQIKSADDAQVAAVETRNKARSVIAAAEQKLKLAPNDNISRAVARLGLALDQDDVDQIRKRSNEFSSVWLFLRAPISAPYSAIFFVLRIRRRKQRQIAKSNRLYNIHRGRMSRIEASFRTGK